MGAELRVYWKQLRMNLLAGFEYKGWWLMLVQVVLNVITDPIATFLAFSRFGSIGPWSIYRIMLIYSLAVTSFGLAETFCRGFDTFPWRMLRTGDFDRLLLRPRSLITQVASAKFHIHRAGRVFTGGFMVGWCLSHLSFVPSAGNVIMLILALIGGFITYAGVFIMSSGIAFYTIQGLDWIYIFTNASYQVARCPVPYMPKLMRGVFTFFMPMLVISYYPASAMCGWGEPYWLGYLALPASLVFLALAILVWRMGVRGYKSAGS